MESLIKRHLSENIRCYILLIIFLVLGAALGSYCAFSYEASVADYMNEFFTSAQKLFETTEPNLNEVFRAALKSSVKNAAFVWLLGLTVIGTAVILILILKSGFMCGFLIGFLIRLYGFKGFGAATVILSSQCLILIPAMLFLSCMAMKFSVILFRMITGKIKYKTNLKYFILRYFCYFLVIVLVLVIYSLSEAYIGANLFKLYSVGST